MLSTISVLVENKFGVLAKIAGLFSSRGYNIKSLTVGETEDPNFSKMTIVTEGDEKIIEQVKKQLHKLIDTIKVTDLTKSDHIETELAFIRVNLKGHSRGEILELANIFQARAVDVGPKSICIEIKGKPTKVNAFIEMVKPYGIIDVTRTGKIAIPRELTS
jgi:acetolactate synthase-1/3 small subunit